MLQDGVEYVNGWGQRVLIMGGTNAEVSKGYVWSSSGNWYERATGRIVRAQRNGTYKVVDGHWDNIVAKAVDRPDVVPVSPAFRVYPGVTPTEEFLPWNPPLGVKIELPDC